MSARSRKSVRHSGAAEFCFTRISRMLSVDSSGDGMNCELDTQMIPQGKETFDTFRWLPCTPANCPSTRKTLVLNQINPMGTAAKDS